MIGSQVTGHKSKGQMIGSQVTGHKSKGQSVTGHRVTGLQGQVRGHMSQSHRIRGHRVRGDRSQVTDHRPQALSRASTKNKPVGCCSSQDTSKTLTSDFNPRRHSPFRPPSRHRGGGGVMRPPRFFADNFVSEQTRAVIKRPEGSLRYYVIPFGP